MSPMRSLVLVAAVGLALAACGSDEETRSEHPPGHTGPVTSASAPASSSAAAGNTVDRAFIAAMIPHHESALDAAEIAKDRAESDFVKALAGDILRTQASEITTLKRIDAEIADEVGVPGDLGVPEHMQGMSDDPEDLRDANPFDRAFIDMMVPHHQGAIEMAKAELAKGLSTEVKQLAQEIITAQQREIDEMNEFRRETYGAPAPGSKPQRSPHGGSGGQNQAHATPTAVE